MKLLFSLILIGICFCWSQGSTSRWPFEKLWGTPSTTTSFNIFRRRTTYNWGQYTDPSRTTYNWGQHTDPSKTTYNWGQHTSPSTSIDDLQTTSQSDGQQTDSTRTTYNWGQHTGSQSNESKTTFNWGHIHKY